MKLLIFSHSSEVAGAEKSMLDIIDNLSKNQKLELLFIIRKPTGKLAEELSNRNYKYKKIHYTNWAQRTPPTNPVELIWNNRQNKKAIKKIKDVIKSYKPDLVMTNTISGPWAAISSRESGTPHVWFVREYGDTDHGFDYRLGKDETFKQIDELSELIIANSKTMASFLLKTIESKKVSVIYTPFELEKINDLSTSKVDFVFNNKNSLKIVIVGRIADSKGQKHVAEAVGVLKDQGYQVELIVVGDSSSEADLSPLKNVVKQYGIEKNVHLVGYQKNPLPFIKLSDIGVMASRREAFGRTTFEYMALGKPVVGANSGATPEMVKNERNGYLYEVDNIKGLVQAIKKYADQPRLIKKHGAESKKIAMSMMSSKHSVQALHKKLLRVAKIKKPRQDYDYSWLDSKGILKLYIKNNRLLGIIKLPFLVVRQIAKALYITVS